MSEQLYSLLLRLYPRSFRDRYALEMRRVFRDRLRDEPARCVWIDVLVDALFSIPQQHLRSGQSKVPYPESAAPLFAAVGRAFWFTVLTSALLTVSVIAPLLIRGGWRLTVLMAVVSLIALRKVNRNRLIVKSYRAEANDDSVTVRCDAVGMAPLTLRRSEVTSVHVVEPLGMRIHAADPARDLWVPAGTAAYADVKDRLTQWVPVNVTVTSLGAAIESATSDNPLWDLSTVMCAFILPLPAAAGFTIATTTTAVVPLFIRRRTAFKIVRVFVPGAIVLARWLAPPAF
jgi:hypothetical protein